MKKTCESVTRESGAARKRVCSGAHPVGLSLMGLSLMALAGVSSAGCKSSSDQEPAASRPSAPEPEPFTFTLPSDFVPLELRGEGSEVLRAPPGAVVVPANGGHRVERGPKFAIEIQERAPALSELAASITPERRVVEESDVIVMKAGGGYAFVLVRELVPEWDENDRRRFSCSSAGALEGARISAQAPGFERSLLVDMVAACRTLELPRLE